MPFLRKTALKRQKTDFKTPKVPKTTTKKNREDEGVLSDTMVSPSSSISLNNPIVKDTYITSMASPQSELEYDLKSLENFSVSLLDQTYDKMPNKKHFEVNSPNSYETDSNYDSEYSGSVSENSYRHSYKNRNVNVNLKDPKVRDAYIEFMNTSQQDLAKDFEVLESLSLLFEKESEGDSLKQEGAGNSTSPKNTVARESTLKLSQPTEQTEESGDKNSKSVKPKKRGPKPKPQRKSKKAKPNKLETSQLSQNKSQLSTTNDIEKVVISQGTVTRTLPKRRTRYEGSLCELPEDNTVNTEVLPKSIGERKRWLKLTHDVGLYVTCDKCNKSRYLPDCKDPLDLPEFWYCHMNPDVTHNTCDVPEQSISMSIQKLLISNLYNAGSIVWAKQEGYPWWPAMVDDDPLYGVYFALENEDDDVPIMYNVTFFNSRSIEKQAWLIPEMLMPFKSNLSRIPLEKQYAEQKHKVYRAIQHAKKAVEMSLIERLWTYSLVMKTANKTGKNKAKRNMSQLYETEYLK